AGFPVTAAHQFSTDAEGFVFGYHVLHDPGWPQAARRALSTGRAVLVTPGFLQAAAAADAALAAQLRERGVVLPALDDPNRYKALEQMPEAELNDLRDRALSPAGIALHAPARVGFYLFGNDLAVLENFRDEAASCTLTIKGWRAFRRVLQMPGSSTVTVSAGSTASFTLPAHTLVVLRRAR
ncbi:MAG: hypothetical protein QHJ73_18935, partial [Armatimonadota bacterium]|nr:hypothetical protein [Armatimonadota bacterium]